MKNLVLIFTLLLFVNDSWAQENFRKDLINQIFSLIGEDETNVEKIVNDITPEESGGFNSYQLNDLVAFSYFSSEGAIQMISLTIKTEDEARQYFNVIHESTTFVGQKLASFYHEKNGVYSGFSKQPQTGEFNILFSKIAP